MESLKAIFSYTFKEHVRRKVYLAVLLFGLILLGGAVVVSVLAQQERTRMMLDLGLAANELLGLVLAVFVSVSLVLSEVESRAIQLILAHPVRRSHYIIGRFFGAWAAIACAMVLMGALHLTLLSFYGWHARGIYVLALACALGKTVVMGALALLLSLALTSATAAMAFSLFFWLLGHFTSELRFLADRCGNGLIKIIIMCVACVAPDFSYFNYRDFLSAAPAPTHAWFVWLALYAVGYTAAALALSCQLFGNKEF